jgi:NTE family protein
MAGGAVNVRATRPRSRGAGQVIPERVLLVVGLGTFMVFLDTAIVTIAFPDIRADFSDAGLGELSWVLNAYNVVLGAFFVVFGRFADVVGRRRTYIAGVVLFTVASAACALAPSVATLVAARVVQGLGGAMIVPAGLALVVRAFPETRRAHAVGLWGALGALAAGLGPSVGGLLVELEGWRLAFLVNVPLGLVAVLSARAMLVESRAAGRRAMPDLLGSGLLAIAIGAVALGIVEGENWGWASVAVAACAAVAVLAGTSVVRRSRRHRAPVIDLVLLRSRDVALINGLTVAASVAMFAATLCCVLFLTSVWGYSALEAGLAISPAPLATAIAAGPAGKLATRFGYRVVILLGALVWVGGLVFFVTQAGTRADFTMSWLPGILLAGVGRGLVIPTLSGAALALARGTAYGASAAINNAARQLGGVLGVALLLVVVGTPAAAELAPAFDDGWMLAVAFLLVTAAGTAALQQTSAPKRPEADQHASVAPQTLLAPVEGPGVVARLAPRAPAAARDTRSLLAALPLLRTAAPETVDLLTRAAVAVELPAGDALFSAGDAADAAFVVISGRLAIVRPQDDGRPVALLARGALVGEIAILAAAPRTADAVAARDSRLLRVPANVVLDAAERDTALANALVGALGAQLTGGGGVAAAAVARPTTIAVLPTGDDAPAERVAAALAGELSRLGRVAQLDAPAGAAAIDRTRLAEVLEDAELGHEHVLLCSGAADPQDPWTAFCLGQADRVIAVARSPQPPPWKAPRRCDLVWLGGRDGLPALAESLDARTISVTQMDAPAVGALARGLAGASVGLVLSGGGARGLAHLGVLEELEAAGVEVDRIAGAGSGALIGALHAAGMDAEEIYGWCYEWLVRRRVLAELGRPRRGILRDDRIQTALATTFGGKLIEELPRELRCGCADLLARETVVLHAGRVADAVGASLALPGLLAPVVVEGRLLVDGGMLDNLPLAALDPADGPVIVVDIADQSPLPRAAGEPLPSIAETLQRALLLGGADARVAAHVAADVLICPQVQDFGALEYHLLDELRAAGRAAARAALSRTPNEAVALGG